MSRGRPLTPFTRRTLASALRCAAAAGLLPAAAFAQDASTSGDAPFRPTIEVGGRLHLQAYGAANDDAPSEEVGPAMNFLVRRARLELSGELTDRIAFYLAPSFESGRGGQVRLLGAWLDLRLGPDDARRAAVLRAGVQKHPFSRLELLSANLNPVIERGAGRGLLAAGTNDLLVSARVVAWDAGATLVVRDTLRWSLTLGAFNGAGEQASDENDAKSFGARATWRPATHLELGAAAFSVEGIVGADSASRRSAIGLDAAWGRAGEPGLFVLAEAIAAHAATAGEEPLRAVTLVASYHRRLGPGRGAWAIEPAVMLDVADPDARDAATDDRARLARAVLGVWLAPRVAWRTGYELQWLEDDAREPIHALRTQLAAWW